MHKAAYTNPQQQRQHWRRSTLVYVLALAFIGLLSLTSHFLVQSIVNKQEATARVVNLAGRQRMLSQRITLFASELLTSRQNYAAEILRDDYLDAINTLEKVHLALLNGSKELHIPKPTSRDVVQIFTATPINLDQRIKQFLSQARRIANPALSLDERTNAFEQIKATAYYDIVGSLDTLLFQYQKDSETAIRKLQNYNKISLLGMIITLIVEALFIFRPLLLSLYRREQQYLKLLKEMDSEITERVRFQTFTDSLTGLLNRLSLLERIQTSIELAERDKGNFVVISVGIDRFEDMNNSLGHDKGDELLFSIAHRLQKLANGSGGFIGRITGEEFAITLEQRKSNMELMRFLRQLSQSIANPVQTEHFCIQVTASVGLAFYPDDGLSARELLMHANQAMRIAKDEGGNCFRFFQPAMTTYMTRRIKLEQELRQALADPSQLRLFYQPKVDLGSGSIIGVEALLRWQHPEEGMISPMEFIPIAEDSGLILDLGDWVLVQALEQLSRWQREGVAIGMAINVSVKQLLHRDLCDRILALSQQQDIAPDAVQLEITETHIMNDMGRIIAALCALDKAGFTLAIDDFGTGHSSLSRLRDLPVKVLKIDKSFVKNAMRDKKEAQIVKAIIDMGHSLDKTIIAEGIETQEQMQLLTELGCDEGQGYLFARPMPVEELDLLLRQNAQYWHPKDRVGP